MALRLEPAALELRGGVRRDLPRALLRDVAVDRGMLALAVADGAYTFHLGEPAATRWAAAILAPPPSLAAKLGLRPGVLAFTPAPLADPVLAEAVAPHATADAARADLWIATVEDEGQLAAAYTAHRPAAAPLWLAHRKGRASPCGDAAIRTFMRAGGYVDSKSCAVSDAWSAIRYGRR